MNEEHVLIRLNQVNLESVNYSYCVPMNEVCIWMKWYNPHVYECECAKSDKHKHFIHNLCMQIDSKPNIISAENAKFRRIGIH